MKALLENLIAFSIVEKETSSGRVKNKKDLKTLNHNLNFDKSEKIKMKNILFKNILESLSTAEMYLGAMRI